MPYKTRFTIAVRVYTYVYKIVRMQPHIRYDNQVDV